MATIVTVPITLGAGLLTFGWYVGIKFETLGPGFVAGIVLSVVLELNSATFPAIQPDGKTLVI
jgi:hypothetical protein